MSILFDQLSDYDCVFSHKNFFIGDFYITYLDQLNVTNHHTTGSKVFVTLLFLQSYRE